MADSIMFVIKFSGIWAIVGFVFLTLGLLMLKNRKKKEINCTSMTFGKVTDIVRHQDYDSDGGYSSSWHPVFEYNVGELKFIKESPYGTSQSKYAIGQDVEVYYNPEDYNEYYIAGDATPKILATIFTLVGIGAILIAIISAIIVLCK